MPLRHRETLFVVVSITATDRHLQTKLIDTRKVTQLNLLRQESVKKMVMLVGCPVGRLD